MGEGGDFVGPPPPKKGATHDDREALVLRSPPRTSECLYLETPHVSHPRGVGECPPPPNLSPLTTLPPAHPPPREGPAGPSAQVRRGRVSLQYRVVVEVETGLVVCWSEQGGRARARRPCHGASAASGKRWVQPRRVSESIILANAGVM